MTTKNSSKFKNQKIRNFEYYGTQQIYDELYEQAKNGKNFTNLMEIISSEQNLLLAYRSIKKNKGSKTRGTNKNTILDIAEMDSKKYIKYMRARLRNYHPQSVRRVEIPKRDGKKRPLGIPTIENRLIQQSIKQVLEPICEAKFYEHSYGFRPCRGAHHAIARTYRLINIEKFYYVVDIDIKGFFDNVNHTKLKRQMWHLGIRDKNLMCVIGKMLKAEIKGVGIPEKGTPQGGILSPLLANVVLNELDWWIDSQWNNIPTKEHTYVRIRTDKSPNSCIDRGNKFQSLRARTKLKEMQIVRYADDFKIFCKNRKDAEKIFVAVKRWLHERLKLEVSEEKSKIVNLKKHYSEFLGFKIKAIPKGKRFVVKSKMSDKASEKVITNAKERIKWLKRKPDTINLANYNSMVLGAHSYFCVATDVSRDFSEIGYKLIKALEISMNRASASEKGYKDKAYEKFYAGYKGKMYYVSKKALYPIRYIKTKPPGVFNQKINEYTQEGRNHIHKKLQKVSEYELRYLVQNPINNETVEYNDNRLSKYVSQNGKCAITKERLKPWQIHTHHIIPRKLNGKDNYENLLIVCEDIHKVIHATKEETIRKYLEKLKLDDNQIKKLNELRVKVGNQII